MGHLVSIFGLGYVGSVTAACLASRGNRVIGVDSQEAKVEAMASGRSPILEPQVNELVAAAGDAGLLRATTDVESAIRDSDISFICVGTPSRRNGSLDLSSIDQVCQEIGHALRYKPSFHWVVVRSTVLPGTTESRVVPALEAASHKRHGQSFAVCFNPEFLREGTAVNDFLQPPFTVLGGNRETLAPVRELYSWAPAEIYEIPTSSAEMLKYICNAFHALKVSFANEVGTICSQLGVDIETVMKIFKSDTRLNISPAYLNPGFAFGGSCLPKDLRALTYRARQLDLRFPLLDAILPSNLEHIERATERILHTGKRKIGILGLSFKAGTDDLRESPMVHIVKRLIGEGCQIQIWDDNVSLGKLVGSNRQFIEDTIPHISSLLCENQRTVVARAEVVVRGTKAVENSELLSRLRPEQVFLDLVDLQAESSKVVSASARD